MVHPIRFSVSLAAVPVEEVGSTAARAEQLGFSTVTMSDHLDQQAAPLLALAAAAHSTSNIRLMPLVLANDYRNPVVLAKELATLDHISGGRLDVGIGAGWMTSDYEFAGITKDGPGTRIERLSESIDVLKALLSGDEVDHQSDHYAISGRSEPTLVDPDSTRFMLAGGKQRMLTLAGEKADIVGINPGLDAGVIDERAGRDATADRTDQKVAWVREAAGSRFDEIELQTRVHLAMITDDREAVAAELAPMLGIDADDALASPHALVGTVEQCIDEVRYWRDRWGITFVSIDAGEMEAFAPVVEALAGN